MKKAWLLVIPLVMMLGSSFGCTEETVVYTDANQTINAEVNQEFTIALDANPTTGYQWQENHDNSALSLVTSEYKPDEKAPGLVGGGGTQYYRFKTLKTGQTEISLVYKRTWETESIEQKIFTVNIK